MDKVEEHAVTHGHDHGGMLPQPALAGGDRPQDGVEVGGRRGFSSAGQAFDQDELGVEHGRGQGAQGGGCRGRLRWRRSDPRRGRGLCRWVGPGSRCFRPGARQALVKRVAYRGGEFVALRLIKCALPAPQDFARAIEQEQIDRIVARQLQRLRRTAEYRCRRTAWRRAPLYRECPPACRCRS